MKTALAAALLLSFGAGCLADREGDETAPDGYARIATAAAEMTRLATYSQLLPTAYLNDLSVLVPFPDTADERALLLAPSSSGRRGPLLPEQLFDQLPPLTSDPVVQTGIYDKLRVVSMRFDPCHTGFDAAHGGPCEAQIRLQLQVPEALSLESPEGNNLDSDSAVHLIYAVGPIELRVLLAELVLSRLATGIDISGVPLDVHPILVAQGGDSPFARRLKQIVLRHAGAANLTRVAFAGITLPAIVDTTTVFEQQLGHYDVVGDQLVPRMNATTDSTAPQRERFVASIGPDGAPALRVDRIPEGTSADAAALALVFDTNALFVASPEDVLDLFDATLRIDNPQLNGLQTLDCVTCHSSTSTRSEISSAFGLDPEMARPDRYTSSQDLTSRRTVVSPNETNIQFGYKVRLPDGSARVSITQRVVNETAASVVFVNDLL